MVHTWIYEDLNVCVHLKVRVGGKMFFLKFCHTFLVSDVTEYYKLINIM